MENAPGVYGELNSSSSSRTFTNAISKKSHVDTIIIYFSDIHVQHYNCQIETSNTFNTVESGFLKPPDNQNRKLFPEKSLVQNHLLMETDVSEGMVEVLYVHFSEVIIALVVLVYIYGVF